MNKIFKNAFILMAITLVAGVCLGFVYEITKGPIAEQEKQAQENAYKAVFPVMDSMAPISEERTKEQLKSESDQLLAAAGLEGAHIEEAYIALDEGGQVLGLVLNITSTEGYGGDINFSMGIKSDGTVNGIEILSISETAGLGMKAADDEFKSQFAGKKAESFQITKNGAASDSEIDAISGATITSNAMAEGVNAGICYFNSLQEGGKFDE